jgi:hypothetical protein
MVRREKRECDGCFSIEVPAGGPEVLRSGCRMVLSLACETRPPLITPQLHQWAEGQLGSKDSASVCANYGPSRLSILRMQVTMWVLISDNP